MKKNFWKKGPLLDKLRGVGAAADAAGAIGAGVDARVDAGEGAGRAEALGRIHVVGLGGCGCRIVSRLAEGGLAGPKLIAADSDMGDLEPRRAPVKILLGPNGVRGGGCGGDPSLGAAAALESIGWLHRELCGAEVAILTAGLGGGTGTGAAPVLAERLSKLERAPLVLAALVLPFGFERGRLAKAAECLDEMARWCAGVIEVRNERLTERFPGALTDDWLGMADDIALRAIRGVADLVGRTGRAELDLDELRSVLPHEGAAIMEYAAD